ncbi:type 1 glutamine amidotransferase domain-containing protein [Streptomyces tauricus]|uniref:type 1 glutamine amidotransferase domain-containing protein n=1 Tax=Streptomyces tauricus TaxID=68274 RepID=UPI0022437C74|nr:type 1 glutamine amidotransferase domain-containing protein [Streptomyces tauricus]MCW8103330.1 type 1 glutamine amidotransferase domain-containing protein [Streptomyces tauricus]
MRVLVPLPDRDFDVTEVAVPWHSLTNSGHEVTFATESAGTTPEADPRLLTGVLFGRMGADSSAKSLYTRLTCSKEFASTLGWDEIVPGEFDGLLLPGGHAAGMRQYLESEALQKKVSEFWSLDRPVGAICHGVLVLARTTDPATGHSVLARRQTTCLPKYMERAAFFMTAWRLGRYYRTSPAYVEDEVKAALDNPEKQFQRGGIVSSPSAEPRLTTQQRSPYSTGTTCRRVGLATPISSPAASGISSNRRPHTTGDSIGNRVRHRGAGRSLVAGAELVTVLGPLRHEEYRTPPPLASTPSAYRFCGETPHGTGRPSTYSHRGRRPPERRRIGARRDGEFIVDTLVNPLRGCARPCFYASAGSGS